METSRHVELERFAKKADGYRAALQSSPQARNLELLVVASLLRGHCKRRRWGLEEVRVVDLMAGSGYLGTFLEEVGFRRVWTIEACDEMHIEAPAASGVRRIGMSDWSQLPKYLDEIQPHFVVSLAGFHHLIQHEGKKVNRTGSVVWQFEVIHECLRGIPEEGLMLIVDLVEPGAAGVTGVSSFGAWDSEIFRSASGLPRDLRMKLAETESIGSYDACVRETFSGSKDNPALRWFREIVDRDTRVGHDDIALSRDLLRLLRQCGEVYFYPFSCPWIFGSMEDMKYFLLHKFGFLIERKPGDVDEEEVLRRAATTNGVTSLGGGKVGLGWNLAALGMAGRRSARRPGALAKLNISLLALVILLGVRLALKASSYQAFATSQGLIDGISFVLGGVAFSMVFDLFPKDRTPEVPTA